MDKLEWFELLEQSNNAMIALNCGDYQKIVDEVNGLIRLVNEKAADAARYECWYNELETYVDALPLE